MKPPYGKVGGWGEGTSKVLQRRIAMPKHSPAMPLYRYATPLYRSHTLVCVQYSILQQALQGFDVPCGYPDIDWMVSWPSMWLRLRLNGIHVGLGCHHVHDTVSKCLIGGCNALGLVGRQQDVQLGFDVCLIYFHFLFIHYY